MLKSAYATKEMKAQMAEKEALKYDVMAREAEISKSMAEERRKAEIVEREREAERQMKAIYYQQELERQLEVNLKKLFKFCFKVQQQ